MNDVKRLSNRPQHSRNERRDEIKLQYACPKRRWQSTPQCKPGLLLKILVLILVSETSKDTNLLDSNKSKIPLTACAAVFLWNTARWRIVLWWTSSNIYTCRLPTIATSLCSPQTLPWAWPKMNESYLVTKESPKDR